MIAVRHSDLELTDHRPHYPDLVPTDYLSPDMKITETTQITAKHVSLFSAY